MRIRAALLVSTLLTTPAVAQQFDGAVHKLPTAVTTQDKLCVQERSAIVGGLPLTGQCVAFAIQDAVAHTLQVLPGFLTGAATMQFNQSTSSPVSIGDNGLNLIAPDFGSYAAYSYFNTISPGNHPGYNDTGYAFTLTAPGSGMFGPSSIDSTVTLAANKANYLTNLIEGEVSSLMLTTRQGRYGDADGMLINTLKAKSATPSTDTGGALGIEAGAGFVSTTSGTAVNPVITQNVHTVMPFCPNISDPQTGGLCYGVLTELQVPNETEFAAFYGGGINSPAAGTGGFQRLLVGSNARAISSEYFLIVGDHPGTGEMAGDIRQGYYPSDVITRVDPSDSGGAWKLLSHDDSVTMLRVDQAGNLSVAGRLQQPLHTPSSSSEPCTAGQFVDDASYHYVCVTTNTWKRTALSSF